MLAPNSRSVMAETTDHPLAGVLVYEEQAELCYKRQRPAVMTDDGALHDYDLDAIREAGYELHKVLPSEGHRKGNVPLYVFREADR